MEKEVEIKKNSSYVIERKGLCFYTKSRYITDDRFCYTWFHHVNAECEESFKKKKAQNVNSMINEIVYLIMKISQKDK